MQTSRIFKLAAMAQTQMSSYRCETALAMLMRHSTQRQYLSTGCPILDETLGGGILRSGITELAGEAGAGKTQFSLTLAFRAILPVDLGGLGGSACYLTCGEGPFPSGRLTQLTNCYQLLSPETDFLSNILIEECHTFEDVLDCLKRRLPQQCASGPVRLVVIDSVAGMFRTEFTATNTEDAVQRAILLFRFATELKRLADVYHLCVVVVNQVTAPLGQQQQQAGAGSLAAAVWGGGEGGDPVPALGLCWSHCVNTRVLLRRDSRGFLSTWQPWELQAHAQAQAQGQGQGQGQGRDGGSENNGNFSGNGNGNGGAAKGQAQPQHRPFATGTADPASYTTTTTATATAAASAVSAGVLFDSGTRRRLVVAFGPLTRHEREPSCGYVIGADGVRGVRDDWD